MDDVGSSAARRARGHTTNVGRAVKRPSPANEPWHRSSRSRLPSEHDAATLSPMELAAMELAAMGLEAGVATVHLCDLRRTDTTRACAEDIRAATRARDAARRHAILARRTFVRSLLARYLDVDPRAIAIERSCERCGDPVHGRPRIQEAVPLAFSCSSSGSLAAVAIVGAGRVGVDVEQRRDIPEVDALARHVLGDSERAALAKVPCHLMTDALLFAWTQKEAFLKAIGLGLAVDPSSVATEIDPRRPPSIKSDPGWTARSQSCLGATVTVVVKARRQRPVEVRWLPHGRAAFR